MKKFIKYYLLLFLLYSCYQTSANSEKSIESIQEQDLKPIHQFKDEQTKEVVGEVYVNYINDSIFTSLYILQKEDTVYRVNRDGFFSIREKEVSIDNDQFLGYKLISKEDQYIAVTVYIHRDRGKYETDPIHILWHKEKKIFGMLKI